MEIVPKYNTCMFAIYLGKMWILVVICIALLSTAEKAATKDEDPKGRTLYFLILFSL